MPNLRSLFGKHYQNLNRVEISSSALINNYHYLSNLGKRPIAPVLKSNAYGHGIKLVAKVFEHLNLPFICVDSLFEAYELLEIGIKTPILVMGYTSPANLQAKKLPFSFAVYTEEMLLVIKKFQPQAGIHIFVDSGMHREGVQVMDLENFIHKIQKLNLKVEGLMSHLAMGDKPESFDTKKQIIEFQKSKHLLNSFGIKPKYIHLQASTGILNSKHYESFCNVARGGLALYGFDPSLRNHNLKPALKFSGTVAQIKEINKGDKVGYDFTFTAKNKIKIAIITAGYNDGVDRRLSNLGNFLFENQICPILGRVSMNMTVVDVSQAKNIKEGDSVAIYSDNNKDRNSLTNIAKNLKILPYELLVHLSPETKRILV